MIRLRRLAGKAARHARRYVERRTLVVILLLSGLGWGFAQLADETREGETHAFDAAVLLALRNPADPADPLGPPWIQELGRDITALGGIGVLIGITLVVAGYLWLDRRSLEMWVVLAAVATGQAASTLAKLGFDRPRPDLVPHGVVTYTSSFPSGHAMMAAVTYLTLAALLARSQPTRALKIYILAVAIFVTLAVGVSRVYLGVHWPTDVLAGWAAGAGWALIWWTIADRILPRNGAPEKTPAERRDRPGDAPRNGP